MDPNDIIGLQGPVAQGLERVSYKYEVSMVRIHPGPHVVNFVTSKLLQ